MAEKALTIDATSKLTSQVNDADILMVGTGIQSNTNGLTVRPAANGTSAILLTNVAGTGILSVDTSNNRIKINSTGTAPTAQLHISGHTAAAGSAPIKLTSGTAMTTPEDGAIEYHGSHLWFTIGATRYQLDQQSTGSYAPVDAFYVVQQANGTLTNELVLSNGTGTSVGTGAGTIAVNLTSTGVGVGSYTYASITVDAQGRLSSASSGSAPPADISGAPFVTWQASGLLSNEKVLAGTAGRIALTDATFDLASGIVTPGSATYASITVDTYGRVTALSSGTPPGASLTGYTNAASTYATALGVATAGSGAAGNYRVLVGYGAGAVNTGADNVLVGGFAGGVISTHAGVVAVGRGAAGAVNTGSGLFAAVGHYALGNTTYGAGCSMFGPYAGYQANATNAIAIGYAAGYNMTGGQAIAIGYYAAFVAPGYGQLSAIAIGEYAGYNGDLKTGGIAIGGYAMYNAGATYGSGGDRCIAIGYQSMYYFDANTSQGTDNTAVGYQSLYNLGNGTGGSPGSNNTAVGSYALRSVSSANGNSAVGNYALYRVSTGAGSAAVGYYAGYNVTTGSTSAYLGYCAGGNTGGGVTAGSNCVGIGAYALYNSVSNGHVAIGYEAMLNAGIRTDYSMAVGYQAMRTAVGFGTNSSAYYNTAVGYQALYSLTTTANDQQADHNTMLGYRAGFGMGAASAYNTAVGSGALDASSAGMSSNTAVGYSALGSCTNSGNTAVGSTALAFSSSGGSNTAVGNGAGYATTTTSGHTFVGVNAGYGSSPSGTGNSALGYYALGFYTSASYAVGLGYYAGANCTSANYLVAIGYQAAYNASYTMTGNDNIAIGRTSLDKCTAGYGNVAIGLSTLTSLTGANGMYNVAIGTNAGDTLTTGYYNVAIGVNSDVGASNVTCIAIGESAICSATGGTVDKIQLGSGNHIGANETMYVGASAGPTIDCYAASWLPYSDARSKVDVVNIPHGLDLVEAMRPVSFRWKRPGNERQEREQYGFLAQEVKEHLASVGVENHGMVTDDDAAGWALSYDQITAPLVRAVQELSVMVKELQQEVAALKAG